eukprot:TRINITY_DN51520_c0_g1_i1.p2 TRINITY_DN51520_c0_g1~~TRINITY_DN51520_c0_g1_i1.p2  ORF type:complete len:144 (+),score=47.66 TRINITY_DN51520_c0_g1_i1:669-1100(+)
MDSAIPFLEAQQRVSDITQNRVIVGHSLQNDLKALRLSHPARLIRDLTLFSKFCPTKKLPLKYLAQHFLKRTIQVNTHDSVEDARASMDLYKLFRKEWEKEFARSRDKKSKLGKLDTWKEKVAKQDDVSKEKLIEAAKAIEMC